MSRLAGLLGRRGLGPEDSLWIVPCRGIHTIGMRFPIDVLFVNRDHKVVAMAPRLAPNGTTRLYFTAHSALELPVGSIEKSHTEVGDQLDISVLDISVSENDGRGDREMAEEVSHD